MNKLITEEFQTIDELLKELRLKDKNSVMLGENSSCNGSYDFTKTNSYEEAEELITNGYIEILDKIKSNLKFEVKENSKIIPRNNVYGFIPNVPNAIRNLPNSMIDFKRLPRKIPTIDLIYCPTANGGTPSDDFIKAGIKILNIINSLEKNNIRVKLSSTVYFGINGSETCISTVCLKNYKEKLNLQKICFPIAHPSMLRRFGFRWLETTKGITNHGWAGGYGTVPKRDNFPKLKNNTKILLFEEIINSTEEEIIKKIGE